MFEKVVAIFPWPKKKTLEESEEVTVPAPKEDAPALGQITVSAFEQMLTRVETAKKVAEIREHHAGINRNRVRRLFRALGIAIAVTLLFSLIPSKSTRERLLIDKVPIAGTTFPVLAALPNTASKGHIAVIKVSGVIGGTLHGEPIAANTPLYLENAFAAAEKDPDLAGVILEIDSPGGGSAASEQSYRIVKAARERLAKRKIRVIAYTSLGAFSGGYYIAMGVGHGNFFADPSAMVANVGVIMSMLNTAGLGEMFGVTENIVKTGPLKSTGSQWEKLTPEQRTMLQESVDDSFKFFLEAVSESRHISMTTLVRESQLPVGRTNGAWFSAKRALEKKLIDGIVPVERLYGEAAVVIPDHERFDSVEFVEYRARLGALEQLTKGMGRISGVFLRKMFSEITHHDAPMRSERE